VQTMNEIHRPQETSLTALVSGIISDAQELIKKQLTLTQKEIKEDFRKTKEAILPLLLGGVVILVGAIVLCFALAHFLEWAFRPNLSLAACYGIVGGLVTGAGVVLVFVSVKMFSTFNPLPDQTVEALKENVQWKTNPK